ncbi:hypothetical protein F0256_21905 [Vibrio europaeus]|nr:hypothetical protein [Vibrio europaeus]
MRTIIKARHHTDNKTKLTPQLDAFIYKSMVNAAAHARKPRTAIREKPQSNRELDIKKPARTERAKQPVSDLKNKTA